MLSSAVEAFWVSYLYRNPGSSGIRENHTGPSSSSMCGGAPRQIAVHVRLAHLR